MNSTIFNPSCSFTKNRYYRQSIKINDIQSTVEPVKEELALYTITISQNSHYLCKVQFAINIHANQKNWIKKA